MKISRNRERIMRRWKEQRWILDNIVRTVGVDWDQGRTNRLLSYCGSKVMGDVQAIRQRVRRFADIGREFAKAARKRQAKAEKAGQKGTKAKSKTKSKTKSKAKSNSRVKQDNPEDD